MMPNHEPDHGRHSTASAPHALLVGLEAVEEQLTAGGLVAEGLVAEGLVIDRARNIEEALAALHAHRPAVAAVAIRFGESSGLAVMDSLHRQWPQLPVLLLSAHPVVSEAVRAMQAGAAWYGGCEAGPELNRVIRALLDSPWASASTVEGRISSFGLRNGIVGRSKAIRRALRQSALVAPTRTTVLLFGETGTGKERLAQAIHEASPRRRGPFVAVNCAALAETLLESELFGHEKGAFSGAHSRREGRFKLADRGTIFLDEIGEIPPATQVKLLRVLQERRFERAGGNQTLTVDVRIVAATNRNLREMVAMNTFRADLFYRLNVMAIEVPPLRERREDIPLLVEHLLPRLVMDLCVPQPFITPEAMETLVRHTWPGNVRELENVLQRALVMAEGRSITAFELPRVEGSGNVAFAAGPPVPGASFREIERHVIMTTYEACGRSPQRTAEVLGLSPRTVHYRLREYRGEKGRRLSAKRGATSEGVVWTRALDRPAAPGAGQAEPES
jgi:two-component system, NtrC family, response regulator HydG